MFRFDTDVIFENLKQIGNLTVTGLINRCHFNDIISSSIKRNPNSLTYNLTGKYSIPKIIINGNARFGSSVNEKRNFLPQLVQVNDHRSLKPKVYFVNDITAEKVYINNVINHKNFSTLINDAVFINRPQRIMGMKTFKSPIKIYGQIDQSKGKFFIKKHFNDYNLTDLFNTAVKRDDNLPIYGKKIFIGNITFGQSVRLGRGLNGQKFPNDFVLTYTNETIYGKVNFHKKVHIHRNLNAQLINHINVTEFVNNAILINDNQTRQISATVKFMHPIIIKKLNVHKFVNDIPVDNLVTKFYNDSIKIPGQKTFKNELLIDGQLLLENNMINNVNLVRDIKNEWIDRRKGIDTNDNITGRIIFENVISADSMKIVSTLNGLPMEKFNSQLSELDNELDQYKETVMKSLRNTKQDQQLIDDNYAKNFMSGTIDKLFFLAFIV